MDIPLFDTSTMILVTFVFVFTTHKGLEMLTELGRNIVLRIPVMRGAIPAFVSIPCIFKALVAENERCGKECQAHRTETLSRFSTYIMDSTLDQEFKTGFFKLRTLWINWILLRKIHQAQQDDNLDLHDETTSPEKLQRSAHNFFADKNNASLEHQAIDMSQELRLMKLTTAAYGSTMVNLVAASSNLSIASNPVKNDLDILKRHNDLRTLRKSMVVVNRNGDWNYADHILIFNHEKKISSLTIRGTFSVADVLTDLDVTPVEFCGGVAPHGMVRMAMNVWEQIKDEVMTKVEENYQICVKGHSLGGGIGMLLTMYLIHEKGISNIRCHAYGAPPVFAGNDDTLKEVSKYITAFIHQDDAIPFMSPYHLRQLNASLTTLDRARQQLSWFQLIKAVLSTRPSPELTKAFLEQPPLEPIAIIAPLQLPAARTVWLRKTNGRHYDAIVCDSKRLGLERGLLLASTMLSDHLPAQYEKALQDLADRGVDAVREGATSEQ